MPSYCSSCDRYFGSQLALKEHPAILSSPQQFRCTRCDEVFGGQEALNQHLVLPAYPYICIDCDRPFRTQQRLDQHMQHSAVHKRRALPQVQTSTKLVPQSPSLKSSISISRQPVRQSDTIASGSRTPQVANYGKEKMYPDKDDRWSVIPCSQHLAVLELLSMHCHSPADLLEHEYLLSPHNTQNLTGLRKCRKCGCGRLQRNAQNRVCTFHPGKRDSTIRSSQLRQFSCCGTTGRGCISLPTHDYQDPRHAAKYRSFAPTPAGSPQKPKFQAVVLDCKMARVKGAKSEVILLCVADYFTGAILLNKLVCPAETVVDWRTEIHGITNSTMEAAISQGQALAGWEEARQELWKLIGDNTILVGHSLQHDLDVLRIIHYRVVDSAILARNVVSVRYRRWGLKALCDELLHIEIRKNGGGVHDCLEEVLATREVVLWCTRNKPELGNWANLKKEEESRKAEVGKIARQRKNSKRENRKRSKAKKLSFDAADADAEVNWKSEESEFLFWSDIAVGLGWPHPDTGYDPWSD